MQLCCQSHHVRADKPRDLPAMQGEGTHTLCALNSTVVIEICWEIAIVTIQERPGCRHLSLEQGEGRSCSCMAKSQSSVVSPGPDPVCVFCSCTLARLHCGRQQPGTQTNMQGLHDCNGCSRCYSEGLSSLMETSKDDQTVKGRKASSLARCVNLHSRGASYLELEGAAASALSACAQSWHVVRALRACHPLWGFCKAF